MTEFQKRQQGSELRSGAAKYVAMTIHVVGTDEGKDYLNGNVILDALCALNQKFAHANIQFFIKDDFNYINNSLLFAHDKLTFPQVPTLFQIQCIWYRQRIFCTGSDGGLWLQLHAGRKEHGNRPKQRLYQW
ncbi:MAG: hypothetical protein IPO07_27145 [Haliscomenobacter sp.]|nr:hypothetical protein [Haliscomenobacter sp.]MBK9492071.1 hypothetical protein [Haliscomenobacter sp.]